MTEENMDLPFRSAAEGNNEIPSNARDVLDMAVSRNVLKSLDSLTKHV